MKKKSAATIYNLKCKTCETLIQVPRPFPATESRTLKCKNGHPNAYSGSELRSCTSEAATGRD